MAPNVHRSNASRQQPAGAWALLWLTGIAGCAWLPLLLADSLPWPRQETPLAASTSTSTAQPLQPSKPQRLEPAAAAAIPYPAIDVGNPSRESVEPIRPLSPFPSMAMGQTSPELNAPTAAMAPVSGALLLGGPLGLESLQERPMVPAARVEQALRARAADRLEAVPLRWRPAMRALIKGAERIQPAEVVRLPAPHLTAPEEYPMAVKPDGVAETTVPPSPASKERLEQWAERQTPAAADSVRPVMVVLEPLGADPLPVAAPTDEPKGPTIQ